MVSLNCHCIVLIVVMAFLQPVKTQISTPEPPHNFKKTERMILEDLLNSTKYDPNIRPPSTATDRDRPVLVEVNLFVRKFIQLDDQKREWSVQVTFRKTWTDPRLAYDTYGDTVKVIHVDKVSSIWTPDVFVINELDSQVHQTIIPNTMIRLYPNGRLLTSFRISLRLTCPMNLKMFPYDTQVCFIHIAPYKHTTTDVILYWKDNGPVRAASVAEMSDFTFEAFYTSYCTSSTATGEYSCLKAQFLFQRDSRSYIRRIYLPTAMLVILTWLSFWIKPSALVSRMILTIGALVAMIYVVVEFNERIPVTDYTKAIDIWTGMCITFAFSGVVELVMVCYLVQRQKPQSHNVPESQADGLDDSSFPMENLENSDKEPVIQREDGRIHLSRATTLWQRFAKVFSKQALADNIDLIFRLGYPIIFALFGLIYWSLYASKKKYSTIDEIDFD